MDNTPKTLLAPGPVSIPKDVLDVMAKPMIHHRVPEFEDTLKFVREQLKTVFETQQPVHMLSSSGSGAMEAAMVNVLNLGDKVVVINSGKFGERWAKMAKVFGLELIEYKVPWGESANLTQLTQILAEHPDCKAVFCQACETSTATQHPIFEISKIVQQQKDCLFVVDGITAIGAMKLPMDEWKIDVLVSGAQKAFMLPAGLAFIALSEKAQKRMANSNIPKYYFDLKHEYKAYEKGQTFFSSPVTHIRALELVMHKIAGANLDKVIHRNQALMKFTHKVCLEMELEIYSKKPAPSVTAINVPPEINGEKLRTLIEDQYNVTFMGGQDELKGKIIRIGHLGYITNEDIKVGLLSLGTALSEMGYNKTPNQWKTVIKKYEDLLQ